MKRIVKIAAIISSFMVIAIVALVIWFALIGNKKLEKTAESEQINQEVLWNLAQDWRKSQNLPIYSKDQRLCDIAEKRFMEVIVKFGHLSTEEMFNRCPDCVGIGENLATGKNENEVFNGWLTSPTHLAVLKDKFTHSCIYSHGNTAVQIFGAFENTKGGEPKQTL